eukprot:CAMPEP_0204826356 /NCGR_PEP_ID=MMETSP1346-20131115/4058_1 /ASSEMBLY_ACC=CAM_ASM_000771 /TAXON_ID=215587 /ORGANISM="Aplanochytrium stocchinoi, Strain GSBS06" /LENGTH=361 /DNA_ID=CAMNT_0051954341 /DNA_START=77 /DNA_END=1162 /DNA_ORIENTATION=+
MSYPGQQAQAQSLAGTVPVATAVPVEQAQPVPQGYVTGQQVQQPALALPLPGVVQGTAPVVQQMHPGAAVVQPSYQGGLQVGGYSFVQGRRQFLVQQHFEAIEAAANTAGCGCIEFENKYDVYDLKTGEPILFVKESSGICCRWCCKPNHTATLNAYDVRPGVPPDSLAMKIEKPFRCNCITCCDFCAHQHKTTLGDGATYVGSARKKVPCGGCFSPQLELKDGNNEEITAVVKGPFCCVGGLIELCKDIRFEVNDPKTEQSIGKIIKKKPEGLKGKFKEAVGDHDTFILELANNVEDARVANMIATLLLMDYIFFEGGSPIRFNPVDQSCQCNCWNWYCCGCLCPCHCQCGGNQGGGYQQ